MTSTIFAVARRGDRWCVSVDGSQLATAETAELALETALDAVEILRRSGISADLRGPESAPVEPRSFDPKI